MRLADKVPKRLHLGPASHLGKDPYALTRPRKKDEEKKKEIIISEGPYHFVKTTTSQESKKTKHKLPIGKIIAIIVIVLLGFGVFLIEESMIWLPKTTPTTTPGSTPSPLPNSSYATSICFEGFSLTQNETHLVIEDYASEWAPFYYISLENGTTILHLVPHPVEEDEEAVVAEYAYVSRGYSLEVYSLSEIIEMLPRDCASYELNIYTHDRKYRFTLDDETQKLLFMDYLDMFYLSPPPIGNTVYDVVFEGFNETVFQRIQEQVFGGNFLGKDMLEKVWRLVEWAESNIEYSHLGSLFIQDPLAFMEERKGVCIDYAVFYAAGLLASGFNEAYVLSFGVGDTRHAVAGMGYEGTMLVLEQHLPVMELQDYIQYSEMVLEASISMPIYAYKIKHEKSEFTVEFFELNPAKYEDASPIDGITEEFAEDIAWSLSQRLKASISNEALPYTWEWSWETLRFYSQILHNQWVEYISNLIVGSFTEQGIIIDYIAVYKADSTTLLIHFG